MPRLSLSAFGKAIRLLGTAALAARLGFWKTPVAFCDIGARGGLERKWHWLYRCRFVRPIFFEPATDGYAQLVDGYRRAHILQTALWSTNGTASLYVTVAPGCCSLLKPNPAAIASPETVAQLVVKAVIPLDTVRFDDVAKKNDLPAPEIVKVDVQGGELEVIKGFGHWLDAVVAVELEASFVEHYEGQASLATIYRFLVERGFGLIEARTFGVRATENAEQANLYFVKRSTTTRRETSVARLFMSINGLVRSP